MGRIFRAFIQPILAWVVASGFATYGAVVHLKAIWGRPQIGFADYLAAIMEASANHITPEQVLAVFPYVFASSAVPMWLSVMLMRRLPVWRGLSDCLAGALLPFVITALAFVVFAGLNGANDAPPPVLPLVLSLPLSAIGAGAGLIYWFCAGFPQTRR